MSVLQDVTISSVRLKMDNAKLKTVEFWSTTNVQNC